MYVKIPLRSIVKISLITTNCKKTVAQVKREHGCQYVINGGLFSWETLQPLCKFRSDGKTIVDDKYGYWMYCWNVGNDIKMVHSNNMGKYKNGIACSAMLKDGQVTLLNYNKDQGGIRGRSAIGLDSSGNLVLFCSKDGTADAKSPEALRTYMKGLGCTSAMMLDSGGSSSCDFNGKTVTTTRKVANYICVWTTTATGSCPYSEPSSLIRRGSIGTGAKWVQWHLNQIMGSGLTIDGIFGSKSVAALKVLQQKYGLAVDGICGQATRAKMKELV